MTQAARPRPSINREYDQSYVVTPIEPEEMRRAAIVLTDVAMQNGATHDEIREVLAMIGYKK